MKKSILMFLSCFLIFALLLAGCGKKEDESSVEPTGEEQSSVIPSSEDTTDEEELTGGWTLVKELADREITDDLREKFEKGVKDTPYENWVPVELNATQVVSGTNYRFLCENGEFLVIWEDLNGECNVLNTDYSIVEKTTQESTEVDESSEEDTSEDVETSEEETSENESTRGEDVPVDESTQAESTEAVTDTPKTETSSEAETTTEAPTEPPHYHTHAGTVTKQPSCLETGVITYVCSTCGDTYTEAIAALGHDFRLTNSVPASCETKGYDEYTCARCGEKEIRNEKEALGHDYVVTKIEHEEESHRELHKVCSCGEDLGSINDVSADMVAEHLATHTEGEFSVTTENVKVVDKEAWTEEKTVCSRCGVQKEAQ